jgi:hypothetical protein
MGRRRRKRRIKCTGREFTSHKGKETVVREW